MEQLNDSNTGLLYPDKSKSKNNKSQAKVKLEKPTKIGKVDFEEDSESVHIDPWISEIDFDFNVNDSSQAFQDNLLNEEYNFSKLDFDLSDLPTSFDDNDDDVMSSNCLESLSQYKLQGKKRKYNPDAVLIASVTEDTLKELKLDPNSKEAKKKRRQIRNRMSAQFHRDRKNAYIEKLEDILRTKEKEIKLYQEEISFLKTENALLRDSFTNSSNIPTMYYAQPISATNTLSSNTDNEDNDSQSLRSTSETSTSPSTVPILPMSLPPMSFAPIDTSTRNGFFSNSLSSIAMVCMMTVMILQLVSFNSYPSDIMSPIVMSDINSEPLVETVVEASQIHRRLLEVKEPVVSPANHGSSNSSIVKTGRRYLRSPPSSPVNESSLSSEMEENFNRLKSSPLLLGQAPASHVLSSYDWSSSFNNRMFEYQSFSSLILTEGKVLLDPSLSFKTNSRKGSPFGPIDNPTSSRSSKPVPPIQSLSALPYPTPKLALPSSKDITTVTTKSNKLSSDSLHLYKPLPPLLSMGGETVSDLDYEDSIHNNAEQNYIPNMLTGSNIMTLLLPTSTIRLGKNWMESEDSTVESIMNVLNITQSDNENMKLNSHSVSLEVHCVIVGAKLVQHS